MNKVLVETHDRLEKPVLDTMLKQFSSCDWGNTPDDVWLRNDENFKSGKGSIAAYYKMPDGSHYEVKSNGGRKIIITDNIPF